MKKSRITKQASYEDVDTSEDKPKDKSYSTKYKCIPQFIGVQGSAPYCQEVKHHRGDDILQRSGESAIFYDDEKTCYQECSKKVVPKHLISSISSYLSPKDIVEFGVANKQIYKLPNIQKRLEDVEKYYRLLEYASLPYSKVPEICEMIQQGVEQSAYFTNVIIHSLLNNQEVLVPIFKCMLNNPNWKINDNNKLDFIRFIEWDDNMDLFLKLKAQGFFQNLPIKYKSDLLESGPMEAQMSSEVYKMLLNEYNDPETIGNTAQQFNSKYLFDGVEEFPFEQVFIKSSDFLNYLRPSLSFRNLVDILEARDELMTKLITQQNIEGLSNFNDYFPTEWIYDDLKQLPLYQATNPKNKTLY